MFKSKTYVKYQNVKGTDVYLTFRQREGMTQMETSIHVGIRKGCEKLFIR